MFLSIGSPICWTLYQHPDAHEGTRERAYICVTSLGKYTEHITIQGTVIFVKRRLTPSAWMETPLSAGIITASAEHPDDGFE
jgi:hypothetical protein